MIANEISVSITDIPSGHDHRKIHGAFGPTAVHMQFPCHHSVGGAHDIISCFCGQRIGGLLNATFGNATELIIAFVAMKAGLFDVVKASLAGSVIGNILLVLGMSMLVGGLKYKTQNFNRNSINITSSMLLLAVLGLSIPAIFNGN